jgi:hypothetical protein
MLLVHRVLVYKRHACANILTVPADERCSNILPPWVISGRAYIIPSQGSGPNVSMGWHIYFNRLFLTNISI